MLFRHNNSILEQMRQETSWEINYKLRQDFKVEHSGKEIRISFIALPPMTLNMFRMTVWTISMESLWRPHRSKYPDKQGWCCLLCGQYSLTTASINYRVSRKLFVKRPPHFCSSQTSQIDLFSRLCWTTVCFRSNFQITNKTITTSSSSSWTVKLMWEGQNAGGSNFPNNNNSLPLFIFLSLLWLQAGRWQRKLEMKGLTAINLEHQHHHPSRLILLLWGEASREEHSRSEIQNILISITDSFCA